jgi:hypothetical protein
LNPVGLLATCGVAELRYVLNVVNYISGRSSLAPCMSLRRGRLGVQVYFPEENNSLHYPYFG